jgi:hypothetical protein
MLDAQRRATTSAIAHSSDATTIARAHRGTSSNARWWNRSSQV